MENPVPMVSRSSAAMARPSKSNSANIRCRHPAVISGKYGCNARVTSPTTSRELSFIGSSEDMGLLHAKYVDAVEVTAGWRYYLTNSQPVTIYDILTLL